MSQNDFVIGNQTFPDFRSGLNSAIQALASLSSGASEPSTTYANMLWYDSGNNLLKMRTEADDAWITIGELDQSTNTFKLEGNTQDTSVWEAGTSTVESLVSPAKVRATQPTGFGELRTYANLQWQPSGGGTINAGDVISGSDFVDPQSGTWRYMGSRSVTVPSGGFTELLFLRIT